LTETAAITVVDAVVAIVMITVVLLLLVVDVAAVIAHVQGREIDMMMPMEMVEGIIDTVGGPIVQDPGHHLQEATDEDPTRIQSADVTLMECKVTLKL
jgi:hypothetical protein